MLRFAVWNSLKLQVTARAATVLRQESGGWEGSQERMDGWAHTACHTWLGFELGCATVEKGWR